MATEIDTKKEGGLAEAEELFHIVCDEDTEHSVVAVGVCMTQAGINHLLEHKALKPQLLVYATRDNSEVARQIVPLDERGVAYLAFRSDGEHKVHARIVWANKGGAETVREVLLQENDFGTYKRPLSTDPFTLNCRWVRKRKSKGGDHEVFGMNYLSTATVHVSPNNFAKPAPEWLKRLVHVFFPDDERDECQLRRRSMATAPMLFTVLPLHYAAKLIGVVFCLLSGQVFGLSADQAIRPYRHGSFNSVFGSVVWKKSYWMFSRESSHRYRRRSMMIPVFAFSLLVALGAAVLIAAFAGTGRFMPTATVVFMLCFGGGTSIALLSWVLSAIEDHRKSPGSVLALESRNEAKALRSAQREHSTIDALGTRLSTLSCEVEGQPMTIDRIIQRRRRNPVIVYYEIKRRACKPFAK